ncbi:MAG TPA: SMI1/KNR4 family protein [Pirellulaceae bacterium]|jgi:hypothetical protein
MAQKSVHFEKSVPASEETLRRLVEDTVFSLPSDYIAFLRQSNGCEGELGIKPGWVQVWPAEKVLKYNEGYETTEAVPGFFAFGSNGGGEMFCFDLRTAGKSRVVMIPFIPMEIKEAFQLAGDFREFANYFGKQQNE